MAVDIMVVTMMVMIVIACFRVHVGAVEMGVHSQPWARVSCWVRRIETFGREQPGDRIGRQVHQPDLG